jgi:hypothetical protein
MKMDSIKGGNKIPQAAIDAAYRLMDRVKDGRKKQLAMEQLEENTSVNMSPYKEAIQNAETPKAKAAKNKISDLTRK